MPMGNLIKDVSTPATIKGLMVKKYKDDRLTSPLKIDDDSYVRASGAADLCPREEVICSLNDIVRTNKTGSELLLTFAHGSALHWVLQNNILPRIGIILGEWICLSCGKIYGKPEGVKPLSESIVPKPQKCITEGCKSDEFYYKELHFKDPEYRIAGHPDGFLSIPGMPGLGLLEAKSASSFSALKIQNSPYMSHIVQCQIYMWLTQTKWAKVLYWDKGATGISAFTEHTIYKDEEMIELIKGQLKVLWDGIKTQTIPERTICDSKTCDRAKKCPVANLCFKGE